MSVASTSKLANKTVNREMWYDRITRVMRNNPDTTYCIADLAQVLNAEKSTVSARLNEMATLKLIQYAGKQRSRTTGLMSKHYQLMFAETLF